MLYIYNYLALHIDNNVTDNMTFVGSYCLFLVVVVKQTICPQKSCYSLIVAMIRENTTTNHNLLLFFCGIIHTNNCYPLLVNKLRKGFYKEAFDIN